jgi:hypothetical protein
MTRLRALLAVHPREPPIPQALCIRRSTILRLLSNTLRQLASDVQQEFYPELWESCGGWPLPVESGGKGTKRSEVPFPQPGAEFS